MAIAPIDLQTLFTQVDKVGRTQIAEREGQALHQAILGAQIQKKTEEHLQQVNEAQDTGEGADKINDKTQRQKERNKNNKENRESDEEDGEDNEGKKSFYDLRDPSLGKKIDITY